MIRRSHGVLFGIALIFSLAACGKPKAGDSCSPGTGACADPSSFLTCRGGVLVVEPCRGPSGCTVTGSNVRCDESIGAENDPCSGDGKVACSVDRKAFLRCTNGQLSSPTPCRGLKGCSLEGGLAYCDKSIAQEGDFCEAAGEAACTADHTTYLECVDNKFKGSLACRGPKACSVEGTKVFCDTSAGQEGDPCTDEGKAACAPDGKSYLYCDNGHFGRPTLCLGPKGCYVTETMIRCDMSIANVGDACKPNTAACTADERTFLQCANSHYVAVPCTGGKKCKHEGTKVLCAAP